MVWALLGFSELKVRTHVVLCCKNLHRPSQPSHVVVWSRKQFDVSEVRGTMGL